MAPFWYPEWSFWWSRVHRDTQQAPRGPGLHFYWFWDAFGESPGTHFGDISVIFLWFGVPKWETVSRSMFLMTQGWKCCLNAVAVCARTTVKPVVFEWFHFFHLFTNLVSWGRDLAHIWVSFGDPGCTFSDFLGSWRQAWNVMIFQGYPGGARAKRIHPEGGNGTVGGL